MSRAIGELRAPALILRAEGLSLRRGRRLVYQDLSISFGPGVTAILGPNGAGKTTLLDGLLRPTREGSGAVSLDGVRINDAATQKWFYGRVGYMPQEWRYFRGFTAYESVAYNAWLKGVNAGDLDNNATAALDGVGLSEVAHVKVRRLSGGMQQRVGLAEAFVNDPRVVLLDEPTVGLDPAQRAAFRRFVKERGVDRAVVLSTHLIDDVEAIADRVIVIRNGHVAFDGSPTELAGLSGLAVGGPTLEAGYLSVVQERSDEGLTS